MLYFIIHSGAQVFLLHVLAMYSCFELFSLVETHENSYLILINEQKSKINHFPTKFKS